MSRPRRSLRFDVPRVIPSGQSTFTFLLLSRMNQMNSHGAASCRFATRPVRSTRPGHPDQRELSEVRNRS